MQDHLLVYATGGFAVGHVSANSNLDFTVTHYDVSGSNTEDGWTAGAGIGYAISNNWSVKVEYL